MPRSYATLAFNVVQTYAGAASVVLPCDGGPYAQVTHLKITAIQVAALTNTRV